MERLVGLVFALDIQVRAQCLFDIGRIAQCIGSEQAVRDDGAARVLQRDGVGAQHVGLHLVPQRVTAAAFRDGQAAHIHAGSGIQLRNLHVVVADGLQHGAPQHGLVGIERQVQEAARGGFDIVRAAREVRQEHDAVGTRRHALRALAEHLIVIAVGRPVADAVLVPAQRQTARTDVTPIEVCVRQRAAVEDEARALARELGNDAVRGDAEHAARARHIDGLPRLQVARSQHGLHRVAGAAADGSAFRKARPTGHLRRQPAHDIPRLHNAGHHVFRNAQQLQLLVRPALLLNLVAQAPAGHGAPVHEHVLRLQARQMRQHVRRVMHELRALPAEFRDVLHEPACEQRREHALRLRIARFATPDIQVPAVDQLLIVLRA